MCHHGSELLVGMGELVPAELCQFYCFSNELSKLIHVWAILLDMTYDRL